MTVTIPDPFTLPESSAMHPPFVREKTKGRNERQKQNAETNKSHVTDSSNVEDELDSLLFKPMPPNKRNELNSIVEKLLNISSNYVSDEPTSTTKLRQEFGEIFDLVKRD